eukprot:6180606-Pleurochrysis_carterae.AAC.2
MMCSAAPGIGRSNSNALSYMAGRNVLVGTNIARAHFTGGEQDCIWDAVRAKSTPLLRKTLQIITFSRICDFALLMLHCLFAALP